MRVFIFILMLFAFVPPAMAQQAEGAYTCPMHPEISGKEGARCPVCGMNLAPKEEVESKDSASETMHEHNHGHGTKQSMPEKAEDVYICPMHPHITGKDGDDCPICGMHLVPKNEGAGDMHEHDKHSQNGMEGAISIDPSYTQTLGVKTTHVTYENFGKAIRAFGKVAGDMRNEREIAVQEEGWIKNLKTSAVGDVVKKGDVLFSVYSPELMAAQSDFLIGRRTGYKIGNPEQRLKLKGMDEQAIALLKKKGKMMEHTPFHAPMDSVVTRLNVRDGSHLTEGEVALVLQDFSNVWINADVPLRDIAFLQEGTRASVSVPETGQEYETVVDYIHPVSNPQNRTVTVRLVLENPYGILRPDSYVDIDFDANTQPRLSVPEDAVLYGSMGAYVMEALGNGNFRPVMVKTGITASGLTEIKSGLTDGQEIVSSGQFMLDAESNLRGGMAAMGHKHVN
ncbi:MAG: efflux RND transporter periplasmic adaptor subunit [Rhodospirillales bacterium]|nr:efflux RND transporter periplasmic adaptor subunit [Alphaproteobacteria bacterium]USO04381.1 MAG: efflux RND transporter periplasmic adaptor subunit [Rhodospirillales bacterium]